MINVCEPGRYTLVTGMGAHSCLQTSTPFCPTKSLSQEERVLFCGQRNTNTARATSGQRGTAAPHLCFTTGGCAQSWRKTSDDSRPAVGERINQYSKFGTVRADGTQTYCSPRRSVCQARSRERVLGSFRSRIKHKVSGLQMDGKVLSVVRPPLWSGMQSVLIRQTGSGESELPGTPHSSTAHASLCGRFTSLRPTRFHYNGSPPDCSHSRVTGMEDKHEQVCLDSVQVTFLGRSIQSTPEGICIKIIQEELLMLKKGVQRVLRNRVTSARVIFRIAGKCIVVAKVVIPAKLCLQSLAEENALERAHDVNDKCAGHLHWWYKNAECWNCHFLSNQLISLQMLPLLPTGAGGRVSTATRLSDSGIGRQLGSQSPVESC